MNVTHVCQAKVEEGHIHGRRFQLPPNNPYNVTCPDHPDAELVQTEFFGGANFFNVDEDQKPTSAAAPAHLPVKGAITTPDFTPAQSGPTPPLEDAPPPTATVTKEEQEAALTAEWRGLTGRDPDLRWGLPRLRAEVEIKRAAAKIAREEAEALQQRLGGGL